MYSFYLDQTIIAYDMHSTFALLIMIYLLSLKNKIAPTWCLIVFMACFFLGSTLKIVEFGLVQTAFSIQGEFSTAIINFINLGAYIALLQFVYHLPYTLPNEKKQQKISLIIFSIIALSTFLIDMYLAYNINLYQNIPFVQETVIPLVLLATVLIAIYRSLKFSAQYLNKNNLAPKPLWLLLLKPQGLTATNMHLFATYLALYLAVKITTAFLLPPPYVDEIIITEFISGLILLFVLILIHFNSSPQPSTLLAKIVGTTLFTVFLVMGLISFIVGESFELAYRSPNLIAPQQTIRFQPNQQGGYDISRIPFNFEADLGKKLKEKDFGEIDTQNLGFSFPFYNQQWSQIDIDQHGLVTFANSFNPNFTYKLGLTPAIIVLPMDFAHIDKKEEGGIFSKRSPNKFIVTWYKQPASDSKDNLTTLQLTLYQNGTFDFTYDTINPTPIFRATDIVDAPYLVGIIPGTPATTVEHINYSTDLPYSSKAGNAVFENYYYDFRGYLHQQMLPFAYGVNGMTLVVIIVFPLFFKATLVKPLNALVTGLKQVNAGNLDVNLPVLYQDETGFLTESFNNMVQSIKKSIETQNKLVAIEQELLIAQTIQQSLLPVEKPNWSGITIATYSQAAREVGGDLYAYHAIDKNRFAIAVGDVSGKGTPAALLMAVSLASFQTIVQQGLSPSNLLTQLDTVIAQYTKANRQNCAMCYAEFDKSELSLKVANAGCIPPYIKRSNGRVEWHELGGFALGQGLGATMGYQEMEIQLTHGDMVILSSDGVVEANNPKGEIFGFDALLTLIENGPVNNPQTMLAYMLAEIESFTQNAEPHDDLTIVIIQV